MQLIQPRLVNMQHHPPKTTDHAFLPPSGKSPGPPPAGGPDGAAFSGSRSTVGEPASLLSTLSRTGPELDTSLLDSSFSVVGGVDAISEINTYEKQSIEEKGKKERRRLSTCDLHLRVSDKDRFGKDDGEVKTGRAGI